MRVLLRPQERRPDPEPLRTDDRRVALVGIGVWAVLAVVAVVRWDDLVASGRTWWLWSCLCGIVLGLLGLVHLHRREVRLRTTGSRPTPEDSPTDSPDTTRP